LRVEIIVAAIVAVYLITVSEIINR